MVLELQIKTRIATNKWNNLRKMSKILPFIIVISIGSVYGNSAISQEPAKEASSDLLVSADIVSSFIWRGRIASPTPNFQPIITYAKGKFEMGLWGSGDITGKDREMDVFVSYSIKGLSLIFTDYYWNTNKKYFNFKSKTTAHLFEFGFNYEIEKIPLQFYAGTMLYGEDKKITYDNSKSDSTKNNYSTYFEISYTFKIAQNSLDIFVGATPFTGIYGSGSAIVFAGLSGSKEIKITDKYVLPVFATFALNPQTEDFFIVFGISL